MMSVPSRSALTKSVTVARRPMIESSHSAYSRCNVAFLRRTEGRIGRSSTDDDSASLIVQMLQPGSAHFQQRDSVDWVVAYVVIFSGENRLSIILVCRARQTVELNTYMSYERGLDRSAGPNV